MGSHRHRSKHPWYSEEAGFFGKGYLQEYFAFTSARQSELDVALAMKVLRLKKGMQILDLACGHGRHAVVFAKRGLKVTGLDLNGFFLKEAKKAAKKTNVSVRFVHGDMRKIPYAHEFDAIVSLFTSFGYLENDTEDQKVLHAVARALKPKGKFLIDIRSIYQLMKIYTEHDWAALPDGASVLTERHFNVVLGRNEEQRIRLRKDGTREEYPILCRMYTVPELVTMCREAGMHFLKAYGDDGKPPTIASKRIVCTFEKR